MSTNTNNNPTIYDRIYLKTKPGDGRQMVVEYLEGGKDSMDEWRLIDLNTGNVFSKDRSLHEIIYDAAALLYSDDPAPEYVKEAIEIDYRAFKDIPVVCQIRHIQSLASDLEHDMCLSSNEGYIVNPVLQAAKEMNHYDWKCFYKEAAGEWELDTSKGQEDDQ